MALGLSDADGLDGTGYTPELSQRYLYGSAIDEVLAVEDAAGDVLWGLDRREAPTQPTAPIGQGQWIFDPTTTPGTRVSVPRSQPDVPPPDSTPSLQQRLQEAIDALPAGIPKPTIMIISDFQRIRVPQGAGIVSNGSAMAASCLDGGADDRFRAPPPPNMPLEYSSSAIQVQRIAPTPSPPMSLAESTAMGAFSLLGAGCPEMVYASCPPGEAWSVSVNSPLALLSMQDDLAGTEQNYGNPNILSVLSGLDGVEQSLRQHYTDTSLIESLFRCTRREAAWHTPTVENPGLVTQEHIRRLCQMMFEDQQALGFFNFCANIMTQADQSRIANMLTSVSEWNSCTPSPESIQRLASAVARGDPESPYLDACIRSAAQRSVTTATEGQLQSAKEYLQIVTDSFKQHLDRPTISPAQQQHVQHTLYTAAGSSVPAGTHFPAILSYPLTFDYRSRTTTKRIEAMYQFTNWYLQGQTERINAAYEILNQSEQMQRHGGL